ncbi:hypothetical protein POM88_014357 [Heracleum sosnowskyi]|uniref:Aminotransferase class I/classII large domain-containing protein n=1 Tax=Heracleum sosnowskyi TaxID=360622 RepID=A0AAD8J0Y2_9APIA|nr:hypothetical protein POM88_014357 [Heracleum sosnowskyi]
MYDFTHLNLSVGAYRTEEEKPLLLNVVKCLSRIKEYLPIVGLVDFNKLSAKLIFGADSPAIQENRVTSVQCLSGAGSLRVGGEFLARHYHERIIYIPQPTWGNHPKIFTLAGLSVKTYRYYNPETRGLDFEDGGEYLAAQSYAKNMGLYGEHVGALSIVFKTVDAESKVESQLKLVIRPMYSSPPLHGASIVAAILKDSGLLSLRTEDCLLYAFSVAGIVLSVVAYDYQEIGVLVTLFCLFHACVGLILHSLARLRTLYVPNELRGGMMSLSLVPVSAAILFFLMHGGYYRNIENSTIIAFAALGLFSAAGSMYLLK